MGENDKNIPTVAPGIDDREELNEKPNRNEIEQDDYTLVTRLSLDEVDESK